MTEEPDLIEAAVDAYDFEIQEEMRREPQSRLEALEQSFRAQIQGELDGHRKSPFFWVPEDLGSIRFFDSNEPLQKYGRARGGLRNNIRKTVKEMQVSIHNSSFKLSHSKKLSENGIRRMNKSRLTINAPGTANFFSSNYGDSGGGATVTGTYSELMDHVEAELKKFKEDLQGPKMELVISAEEFQVD